MAKHVVLACVLTAGCSSGLATPAPPDVEADASHEPAPCPASSREVTVDNDLGKLHGTLQTPAGCGPLSAIVLVPGSGPTDREGNSTDPAVHPNSYGLLAAGLAERGIASLRYDKAGLGASKGAAPAQEADFRFEMGAADAARWVALLRADARYGRVSFVGHSEGALLAILAAKQAKVDGYVSLEGAGRPIGAVLREQLARALTDPGLLASADAIIGELEQGRTVADVPAALDILFRPSVQPYLISWMKYDPANEISMIDAPVLIVQGTTDIQVGVGDAQLLKTGRPDATLALIEEMNHVLKAATLDTASQNAAYADPNLPIVGKLFDALEPALRQP